MIKIEMKKKEIEKKTWKKWAPPTAPSKLC